MSKGTVNKAMIIGRLGRDAEVVYAASGIPISNFSVATNHSKKDANGNWEEMTEWHNIVAFNKLAEFAGEYLKKGVLVYVEGRLQTRSWEDQNGVKKYKTEIAAYDVSMLGSKSDNQQAQAQVQAPQAQAQPVQQQPVQQQPPVQQKPPVQQQPVQQQPPVQQQMPVEGDDLPF